MTFIDCVQWGAGGRAAATFLTKGSLIACTGELRLREASTAGGPRQFYSVVGRIEFLGEGRKGGATQDVTAAEADSEAVPA